MLRRTLFVVILMPALAASAQITPSLNQQMTVANPSCNNISLGLNGSLNGFVPSPKDAWHQDISGQPVDPLSNTIMVGNVGDLAGYHLHPDFGTQYGIPYSVVDSSNTSSVYQYTVPMTMYAADSDLTKYPLGNGMVIEGNPGDCPNDDDDRHLLVVDRHSCTNYELYQATACKNKFTASNGLLFDLLNTEQRPYGMTSADASGMSIFEGLIRYDEILAGTINHAIRFTAPHTKANRNNGYFIAPATHAAGNSWGTDNIMGMRIRLKANYDISSFSKTNQIILTAMKKYGLILADNGSKLYFQGTEDSRWDDSDLAHLGNVVSDSFEVVKMGAIYDSETAPTGAAPVITSFVSSPIAYQGTTYYILSATTTGATYSFLNSTGISNGSIFRGFMVVAGTPRPTTYTLTSRNLYGTTQATVTVP